jgi:penicillin-binding protein 2
MFSEKEKIFKVRILIFYFFVLGMFVILFFRYWNLQALNGAKYAKIANENTLRVVTIKSKRGKILAKQGEILADHKIGYSILLDRNRLSKKRFGKLANFLGYTTKEFKKLLDKYRKIPLYNPIPVKNNISFEKMSEFEARKKDFPELFTGINPYRYYPYGPLFAHITGYTGEPTVKELRNIGSLQNVGKTGLEKQYDYLLRGQNGSKKIIVDSRGRFIDTKLVEKPINGTDIETSVILPLQRLIKKKMGKYLGAVVVMNVNDGRLYGLVSNPSYNPNLLTLKENPNAWKSIKKSKNYPLINRVTQGKYSPGSIFKLVMMYAALNSGVSMGKKYYCNGTFQQSGIVFRCWNTQGHGELNLPSAIAHSCNVYFYNLGLKLGIDKIVETADNFKLCQLTHIDIPGEKKGLLPSPEWKKNNVGYVWYPGDTVNTSIGQGYLLVTPIEIASLISVIASNGEKAVPHFLNSPGVLWKKEKLPLNERYLKKVKYAMRKVITSGTGISLNDLPIKVAGKTGTAQTISGDRNSGKENSWFAGFAPYKKPEIAIVVIAEKGGHGSDTAAPIAAAIFNFYAKNKDLFK